MFGRLEHLRAEDVVVPHHRKTTKTRMEKFKVTKTSKVLSADCHLRNNRITQGS